MSSTVGDTNGASTEPTPSPSKLMSYWQSRATETTSSSPSSTPCSASSSLSPSPPSFHYGGANSRRLTQPPCYTSPLANLTPEQLFKFEKLGTSSPSFASSPASPKPRSSAIAGGGGDGNSFNNRSPPQARVQLSSTGTSTTASSSSSASSPPPLIKGRMVSQPLRPSVLQEETSEAPATGSNLSCFSSAEANQQTTELNDSAPNHASSSGGGGSGGIDAAMQRKLQRLQNLKRGGGGGGGTLGRAAAAAATRQRSGTSAGLRSSNTTPSNLSDEPNGAAAQQPLSPNLQRRPMMKENSLRDPDEMVFRFWMLIEDFKRHKDRQAKSVLAEMLYTQYIAPSSESSTSPYFVSALKLPTGIVESIEKQLMASMNIFLPRTLFDGAQAEVTNCSCFFPSHQPPPPLNQTNKTPSTCDSSSITSPSLCFCRYGSTCANGLSPRFSSRSLMLLSIVHTQLPRQIFWPLLRAALPTLLLSPRWKRTRGKKTAGPPSSSRFLTYCSAAL